MRIKYFLLKKIAKLFINSIIKTCKLKTIGEDNIRELRKKKIPIIYVIWHRHIFVPIYQFKDTGVRPLISQSHDGEIVYQIAKEFGTNPVRGSSSKGGATAFLKLYNSVKKDHSEIFITADGPKGPLKQIKDGTILLAQKTKSVIIPISWFANRVKVFKRSWDKFIIPLPFSKITFVYEKPFFIPEKIKKDDLTKLKKELKGILDDLEKRLESRKYNNLL